MEVEEKNVELIELVIRRLIEEKREERKVSSANDSMTHEEEEDHQLLSKLLSQLESLKENPKQIKPPLEASELDEPFVTEDGDRKDGKDGQEVSEMGTAEIVKELREVKRQNSRTHLLLSAMILITAFWQFSEVSLFFAVRSKLSNPFKSVGNLIFGALRGGLKESDSLKTSAKSKKSQLEAHCLDHLKIPDLPHVDLSSLVFNCNEE